MAYDWQKIFLNKTERELYEIYIGANPLGKEAKCFAEKELEKKIQL